MLKEIRNKKGWIKIVEAFLAILLVATIVILIIGRTDFKKEGSGERINNALILILRDVETNGTLRQEIVETNGETYWDDGEFPEDVKNRIEERAPSWIGCVAKICEPADDCILSDEEISDSGLREKDIYTKASLISSTIETFNPRQLKIFCWEE